MKRLVSNKSIMEMLSKKWQSVDSSSFDGDIETNSHAFSIETAPPPTAHHHNIEANADQIPKEKEVERRRDEELMYLAALKGDWLAAEEILGRDPNLALNSPITRAGDRALHVATAMKNKDFIEKLLERIKSVEDLKLLDGRGYTACCYAAISGVVEIAALFIKKNPNLATARDKDEMTPLHKAAMRGKRKMLSYLLKSTQPEDLINQEWFDLLLVTISRKMFDVALEIVEINGSVATMYNEQGTALHMLARQHIILRVRGNLISIYIDSLQVYLFVVEPKSFNILAKKLWGLMQEMEKDATSLLALIKKHDGILHDAAERGHVKLITMLTCTYPQLLWETDSRHGYTIFHIAVKFRQASVVNLIPQVGVMIDLCAMSQDKEGNNILHLAAKLAPLDRVKTPKSTMLLQRELAWFKYVEAIVPPSCREMRNNKGQTPRELFSKEHKSLFEYSEMRTRNTADSFMLIATILLTVVYGITFSVPGGYDSSSGKPVLVKKSDFVHLLHYEVISALCSVISIIMFRSIMASRFAEDDFMYKLPLQLLLGFLALYLALSTAFLSLLVSVSLGNPKVRLFAGIGVALFMLCLPFWIQSELGAIHSSWTLQEF